MLGFLSALAAAMSGMAIWAAETGARAAAILGPVPAILLVLMIYLAWATAPAGFVVSDDGITIRFRRWKSVQIAYDEIADAAKAGFDDVFEDASISHNNAYMFSASGTYWSAKLNDFECFCTSQDKLVVIKRKTGIPVIISPADPPGFVEAVRNGAKHEG